MIECPTCDVENPDPARFCLNCGVKLALTCPQCGTELPPQAKFCFACGTPVGAPLNLAQGRPSPDTGQQRDAAMVQVFKRLVPQEFAARLLATRGQVGRERRVVTILFSDVKGSTQMAEDLDPEEVMEIMDGAFDVLIEPVYRHEGTLARLMGDAILAFFGAPIAHEDDPERAIRAGLEIVEGAKAYAARLERERGLSGFNVRVGINTGLVVVGEVGSDLRVEYTAMGDAINLAARMEQNAPVGGILISHDTYRHVRGVFDVRALEPMRVKGKREPVQTYLVERAKPRAFRRGTRGVEGVETRMIGRKAELMRLQGAFYTAMKDGKRQMVTVTGEAGVGKSRLLFEFENWLDLVPKRIYLFKGRASREMQSVPYALIRDLCAFRFQIQDSDPADVVRQKMERGIGEALGEGDGAPARSQMKAHFVGQLLGFDFSNSPHLRGVLDDARQLRDRALVYLSEYFRAITARFPTLVLLEDIHWADDSSLDVLHHLVLALSEQRLLVVCAARPGLFERRPHWGERQTFHTQLELRSLSRQDSRLLVEEILRKAGRVPEGLRELVVGKAEGNPFYVEELIKMLIEDGVIVKEEERWRIEPTWLTAVRVPPTLTGVLQARLDGLPLRERTVMQQASVVGRRFWDTAVVRIGESADERTSETEILDALSALRSREMIFRRKASAFIGTQEYIFKHAILREVTYEGVLRRVRRVYHALIAEWLIERSGERASEYTGLIADHLEAAGQTEQAIRYLCKAGERAAARFANAQAVAHFSRALDLTPQSNQAERYALLLVREGVYRLQGDREAQRHDLTVLKELAEILNDDRKRAEAALRWSYYALVTSDYPAAIAAAQASIHWAQAAQDVGIEAEGYLRWGVALWRQGDYEVARAQLEQGLALAQATQSRLAEAVGLRNLGYVSYKQGDYTRARDYYELSLCISREIGDRRVENGALDSLGNVFLDQGNYAGARDYYEQSLCISREIGDRLAEGMALSNLGLVFVRLGHYAEAKVCYEQGLRIGYEIDDRQGESDVLANLSLLFHHLGEDEAARKYSQQTLSIARELGDRHNQGYALTFLGHALAGLEHVAEAADAYRQALTLRRELGQPSLAMEPLAGLAHVSLVQGDLSRAQTQVEEILRYLETNTLDGTEEPFRVYLTCYRVLRANQDPRAQRVLSTAHSLLQEQAAKIDDKELQRSFTENVAAHREIVSEFSRVQEV